MSLSTVAALHMDVAAFLPLVAVFGPGCAVDEWLSSDFTRVSLLLRALSTGFHGVHSN